MFEETLVESRGLGGSGTQRWTALGSLTVQCAVAGLLIAIPLLRPGVLRIAPVAAPLALPLLRKPPVPVLIRTTVASSTTMSLPAAGPSAVASGATIWPHRGELEEGPAPEIDPNLRMGYGTGLPTGFGIAGILQPRVAVVREREIGPVRVSKGVSEGLLLTPIRPEYPVIAKVAGIQGTVIMEAVISKTGTIESLHAISGPEMLQRAALEAVAAARYRPYLLSGEPTEVKTTITVVFSLGS